MYIIEQLLKLKAAGALPDDLADELTPEGNLLLTDPQTQEPKEVSLFYIREWRPYVAAVAPIYAKTYFPHVRPAKLTA